MIGIRLDSKKMHVCCYLKNTFPCTYYVLLRVEVNFGGICWTNGNWPRSFDRVHRHDVHCNASYFMLEA